jgi:predicted dehydrogenase
VRFDTGAIMHIESSFAAHIKEDTWNFQLMGDKGGATWDPPVLFHDQAGTMLNSVPGWISTKTDFPSLFTSKLRNFVDACLKDTPLNAPGEDGMTVQKIIDGIYRSAEHGGKEVAID